MKTSQTITTEELAQAVRKLASEKEKFVIAISGFGGSGKTTLAHRLAKELNNSTIVSLDDFIIDRLLIRSKDWHSLDFERLKKEVLEPIRKNKRKIQYHKYDWTQDKLGKVVDAKLSKYVIVEGLGLIQQNLKKFFDLKVWIDVPLEVATKRGIERDKKAGNDTESSWKEIWQPNDKDFFDKHHPKEHADLIIQADPVEELKKLTQEIVKQAHELGAKHTNQKDAPVNYVCIFSQTKSEFDELKKAAQRIGKVVQKTKMGPVFQILPIPTEFGNLGILKIRRPDPNRLERGDADFTVKNYPAFKKKYLKKPGFNLISRPDMEMIELVDTASNVLAYYSHPTLAEVLKSESTSSYDTIAKKYDARYFTDLSDTKYVDEILQQLPKDAKVLDLGCGPGQFAKYVLGKGFKVEGIDVSTQMIKIAKKKVPECKFKVMDMRKLDYNDQTFDGILCAYALIHVQEEEIPKVLDEVRRVLKKHGKILFLNLWGSKAQVINEPLLPGKKLFVNFLNEKRLTKFCSQAGLRVLDQRTVPATDALSPAKKYLITMAERPSL